MTLKQVWICDGCDKELVLQNQMGSDWKSVRVTLDGFHGYPTCAPEPVMDNHYHLCPACARRFYADAFPRKWPRDTGARMVPINATAKPEHVSMEI